MQSQNFLAWVRALARHAGEYCAVEYCAVEFRWNVLALCAAALLGNFGARGVQAQENQRPPRQIAADIEAASAALPSYPLNVQLDARFEQQMGSEMSAPLQHLLELYTEFQQADPADAPNARPDKCLVIVRLALYGNKDALQALTDASQTNPASNDDASDAVFGKAGLLMYQWWNSASDPGQQQATQEHILADFETLAKSHPRDDVLVEAALDMARYHSSSDALSDALRDIVDNDLTGRAAIKYRQQPFKIGRPFQVTVNVVGGGAVSTAAWKGEVVLLDFWATWCPPCRASLPKLISLYQADHDKGLEVLGISNDSSLPDLQNFLVNTQGMVWPQSFNPAAPDGWNALSPQMGVHAIPTTVLIDRNGKLRDIEVGYLDEDLLQKLLDEKVAPPAAPAVRAPPNRVSANATPLPRPPQPAASPPAPPADAPSEDQQANALLALANSYLDANLPDRAREKLNLLLQKYPDSAAAPKAKAMLAQLGG